ncbi:MAG: carboxypeptidase-like regulatory domain-containing protein [Bacteroidota bacterium]
MPTPSNNYFIPEPCHEDWNEMTPVEQGRFCDSCSKCVIDLTGKSRAQIHDIYLENQGEVCGRMQLSQMGVRAPKAPAAELPESIPGGKRVLRRLQLFAVALFAVFTFGTATSANAQTHSIKGKVAHVADYGKIEGKVNWEGGHPASGITLVLLKGDEEFGTTQTNENGAYGFEHMRAGVYTVEIRDWSLDTQAYRFASNGRQKHEHDFVLEDVMIEGELMIEEVPAPIPDPPTPESTAHPLLIDPPPATGSEIDEANVPVIQPIIEDVITACKCIDEPNIVSISASSITEIPDVSSAEAPSDKDNLDATDEAMDLAGISVTAFPNPTTDFVKVRFEGRSDEAT